jgi:hypothetical protein
LQTNHLTEESQIPKFLLEIETKLGRKASSFIHPNKEDCLYQPEYHHDKRAKNCKDCDASKVILRPPRKHIEPEIHYSLITSGNSLVKNSGLRDWLGRELGVYCVEMEAAGLMDNFPCLVIRGICDYTDSHKNKEWQGYMVAMAAAFTKELLLVVLVSSVKSTSATQDIWSDSGRNM